MFFFKTTLKRSKHQAFDQRYNQVHPRQHALFIGRFVLEYLIMAKSFIFQTIEALPPKFPNYCNDAGGMTPNVVYRSI